MKNLFRNQNGFSALEVGLAVIVMGLIGGSGYYIYQQQTDESADSAQASQEEQQAAESVTVTGAINAGEVDIWTPLNAKTVILPEWGLQMELPENTEKDLVAAYDKANDSYIFSVERITVNEACKAYFVSERLLAHAGMQVRRVSGSTGAYSQLGSQVKNESQTLTAYYRQNKSNGGDYIEADNGQKYWKVNDSFITATTNPVEMYADGSLKAVCPGLTGDYESQVTDSLETLTGQQ